MKKLLFLFLLAAPCASAQTPYNDRTDDLGAFHGANLCWDTDGRFDVATAVCTCPIGEEYDAVDGCAVAQPDPVCGNNLLETGEVCDTLQLAGETCQTQGFDGGTLACATDCQSYDTSACTNDPPPGGVWDALAAHVPPPGEWAKIPGSEIDVLVQADEFPFCNQIGCFKSQNAFLAWNGAAFDEDGGRWWFHGGGHADYGGNEIYEYNFAALDWVRLTDPSPLGPPAQPGCQTPNTPLVGPSAMHTYDGAIYIKHRNELFITGRAPFCSTGITWTGPMWTYSFDTQTWTKLTQSLEAVPSHSWWDPDRGTLFLGSEGNPLTAYELDPDNGYQLIATYTWKPTIARGTAVFTPDRMLYAAGSNHSMVYRMPIGVDAAFGTKESLPWTAIGDGTEKMTTAMAIHGPSGDAVMWLHDAKVVRIDDATFDSGEVLIGGGAETPPDKTAPNVANPAGFIYSKWVYVEALDVFVGVYDPRDGVWVYRLPDSPAQPEPPPGGSTSSFEELCSQPGVVFCDPLDTGTPFDVDAGTLTPIVNKDGTTGVPTYSWWRNRSGTSCVDGYPCPTVDQEMKASGTGSLKFTVASESSAGSSGIFTTNFSGDLSQTFGEGDTFHFRFLWRADCDLIYTDCDPMSPDQRTVRRSYLNHNGSWTAFKLFIVADGDAGEGISADSCTFMHLVGVHYRDHLLTGYHSCGWYEGWEERRPGLSGLTQVNYQPNGDYECNRALADPPRVAGWGDTGPNCFLLDAGVWYDIQVRVQIGTWQPTREGEPNSHVTMWAAPRGEAPKVIVDHALFLRGPNFSDADSIHRYGKIWLMPYMTNKTPNEQHPPGHVWYDELVVSTQFIEGN